jgi:hypothetical protein
MSFYTQINSLNKLKVNLLTSSDFILILLPETVTNREEVPTSLLIHVPNVCLLTSVLRVRFIDKMHKEEHVVRQIVFLREKKLF